MPKKPSSAKKPTPQSSSNTFGPRCLAPLLNVTPGQTVLFIGGGKELMRVVKKRGATVLDVRIGPPKNPDKIPKGRIHLDSATDPLPLDDASVHHVVAPTVNARWWPGPQLAEVARVAAPGATLLFGASARARFPRRAEAQTPRGGRRRLDAAGFTETQVYGVRHGFHDPRFLVPLDHAGARRWFFASAFPPLKTHHARMVSLLARLPRTPIDQLFFPNLLFVSVRGER